MGNGFTFPQNTMQHHGTCVANFGAIAIIALTGEQSRVRESLAKRLIQYFLTLSALIKLTYFLVKKCFPII